MLLKTQFQYISSLFSYFYFSSFSFPLSSFTMGSATLRKSPTLQFERFCSAFRPVLFWTTRTPSSWPLWSHVRGPNPSRLLLPRALLRAKTVLFFVAQTASSGFVHVDGFLPSLRRSRRGCEGGIRSHTVETLKQRPLSNPLCDGISIYEGRASHEA